jgi:hypothetical protein
MSSPANGARTEDAGVSHRMGEQHDGPRGIARPRLDDQIAHRVEARRGAAFDQHGAHALRDEGLDVRICLETLGLLARPAHERSRPVDDRVFGDR